MSLHETSSKGIKYPFEYEQRAIHYIFQTEKWKERNLPKYKPYHNFIEKNNRNDIINEEGVGYKQMNEFDLENKLWENIDILEQCKINSYFLYPHLYEAILGKSSEVYKQAQWIHGDFVVHMAGHKGNNKRDLFDYCLSLKNSFSEI